ncbi:MAG: hypothetical protein AB8G26_13645 [Ilumatobacter sp.]
MSGAATSGVVMNDGAVATSRAISITYRLVMRQLVTRGRLLALALVGVVVVIVSAAVGANDSGGDSLEDGVRVISDLGFTALVPIVALVFAAASLGDMREDSTLVYLWLRPMDRWPVVVGAWAAAVTVSMPLSLIPLIVSAVLVDAGSALIGATVLAAVIGTLVYSALFVLAGLLVKNAIVWGLAYVLLWEGLVAGFGSFAARIAMRGYTRSIITSQTGVDLDLGDLSLAVGIVVPLVVTVAAIALASARLQSMDVA